MDVRKRQFLKKAQCIFTGMALTVLVYWISFRVLVYPAMSDVQNAYSTYIAYAVGLIPFSMLIGSVFTGYLICPHIKGALSSGVLAAPALYAAPVLFAFSTRTAFFDSAFLMGVFAVGMVFLFFVSVFGVFVGMKMNARALQEG